MEDLPNWISKDGKMNLNINSPMYYTKQFGIIDEIYDMCQDIQRVVKEKKYSPIIDIVGYA